MAKVCESLSCAPRPFTARELQVLALLARGWTNGSIGKVLDVSGQTVAAHITAMRDRIGAADRVDLIVRAIAAGILSVDTSPPSIASDRCTRRCIRDSVTGSAAGP